MVYAEVVLMYISDACKAASSTKKAIEIELDGDTVKSVRFING